MSGPAVSDSVAPSAGRGLRVLVAYDGSASAEGAVTLTSELRWPADSVLMVVTSPAGTAVPPVSSFATVAQARSHAAETSDHVARFQDDAVAALARDDISVESRVLGTPPASAIVAEASAVAADLIVVGSGVRGSMASLLLGSVCQEVTHRAPCSVLVARQASVRRILVAIDRSPAAEAAVEVVALWSTFEQAEVRVVGVLPPEPRYPGVALAEDERSEAYQGTVATAYESTRSIVSTAVARLSAAGRRAEPDVRRGDVANEIVTAARVWLPDLVVVGANAREPLRPRFLGGVTSSVLQGVVASVLVARPLQVGAGQ